MTTDRIKSAKALEAALGRVRKAQDDLEAETTEAVIAAEAMMSAAGVDLEAAGIKVEPKAPPGQFDHDHPRGPVRPYGRPRPWPVQVKDAMPVLESVAKMLNDGGVIDTGCKKLDDTLDGLFEDKFCGGYASGEQNAYEEVVTEYLTIGTLDESPTSRDELFRAFLDKRKDAAEGTHLNKVVGYQVVAMDGDIEIGPLYNDQRQAENEAAEEGEYCRVEEVECAVLRKRTVWETPAPEGPDEFRVVFQVRANDYGMAVRDLTDARVFKSVEDANAYGAEGVRRANTVVTDDHGALKISGYRVVSSNLAGLELSDFAVS